MVGMVGTVVMTSLTCFDETKCDTANHDNNNRVGLLLLLLLMNTMNDTVASSPSSPKNEIGTISHCYRSKKTYFEDGQMDLYVDTTRTDQIWLIELPVDIPIMIRKIKLKLQPDTAASTTTTTRTYLGFNPHLNSNISYHPHSLFADGTRYTPLGVDDDGTNDNDEFTNLMAIAEKPTSKYKHDVDFIPVARFSKFLIQLSEAMKYDIQQQQEPDDNSGVVTVRVTYEWVPYIPKALLERVVILSNFMEIDIPARAIGPRIIEVRPILKPNMDYLIYTGRIVFRQNELLDFSKQPPLDVDSYPKSPQSWIQASRVDRLLGDRTLLLDNNNEEEQLPMVRALVLQIKAD